MNGLPTIERSLRDRSNFSGAHRVARLRALYYALRPSMMHTPGAGTTRVSRKPAATNSLRYSCSVRSLPPGMNQHDQVEELAEVGFVAGLDDAFDDQQLAGRLDDLVHVLQDREGPLIVPVMDDVPHEIGIGPGRHRFEEAARDRLQPFAQPGRLDVLLGPRRRCRAGRRGCPSWPGILASTVMSRLPLPPPTSARTGMPAKS